MKNKSVRSITFCAVMVAVISVVSQIAIPLPSMVPITLQTLVIALCGYFLGLKKGTSAVLVYILLGLVGAPVFASFQGGVSAILGYTGGFIIGFIPVSFLCGLFKDMVKAVLSGIVGVILCHALGILWYMYLSKNTFVAAFLLVSLPYIVKDIIFIPIAYMISRRLRSKIDV